MRLLEIYSGTGSVGRPFKEAGHEVISIDIDPRFEPTICDDIFNIDYSGPIRIPTAYPYKLSANHLTSGAILAPFLIRSALISSPEKSRGVEPDLSFAFIGAPALINTRATSCLLEAAQ